MGDHEARAGHFSDRIGNRLLRHIVEGAGGFVKEKDGGFRRDLLWHHGLIDQNPS